MVDIFGIDIGNAFCSVSVAAHLNERSPYSKYLSSEAYISDNGAISFYTINKRKSRVINDINNRLKEKEIEVYGVSVRAEDVYTEIIRRFFEGYNSRLEKNKQVYNLVLSFPNQHADDMSVLERLQNSMEKVKVNLHSVNIVTVLPKAEAEMINYIQTNRISENRTVLIYDFGHSALDVSVVRYDKSAKMPELLIKDQILPVGGKNFDDVIVNELCGQLNKQYRFIPESDNEIDEIRNAAIKIKHELTEKTEYKDALTIGNECYEVGLSRKRFEELSEDLLLQTISKTCDMMDKAEQNNIKIDEFVLAGGSSRMPMVANALRTAFDPVKIHVMDEPEKAPSFGAARYGYGLFDLREKLERDERSKVLVKLQKPPRAKWLTEYEERVEKRKDTLKDKKFRKENEMGKRTFFWRIDPNGFLWDNRIRI